MVKRKTESAESSISTSAMFTRSSHFILLVFSCYLIFTYNKKCVTYQYANLIREFDLTQQDAGTISSSQQLSISIVTFLAGILTDFLPSSILFPIGLIWCGTTTLLFTFGSGTSYFSFIWMLNGIGHGLQLPTALRLTKEFSTPTTFATNWSFVLTAVNVAGVLNPLVSTFIADRFGWRVAINLAGILALVFGLVSLILFSRRVKQNAIVKPKKNQVETKDSNQKLRTVDLLLIPVLWILIVNRFIVAILRLSTGDWTQMFFVSEKQLDHYTASLYVTIYEFSSIFGKLLSGRINDYCMKRSTLNNGLLVRMPISIGYHVISIMALYGYCYWIQSSTNLLTIALIATISGIVSSGNIITLSVLSTEIRTESIGSEHEGLVTAIGNLSAKVGAFCSGYPFTMIAYWTTWNIVFYRNLYHQKQNRNHIKRSKSD
ncbi:hypothetical protein BLOT_005504 [Blomia tropicalis]|nr:hypothetical protein BLOT_005504 [Blomia tropicalis]